uniref:Uncharacterized protein n=1 Tax=Glossina brevipalpis TaxID=37001 RepID=A0A1A9WDW7_9MUSC
MKSYLRSRINCFVTKLFKKIIKSVFNTSGSASENSGYHKVLKEINQSAYPSSVRFFLWILPITFPMFSSSLTVRLMFKVPFTNSGALSLISSIRINLPNRNLPPKILLKAHLHKNEKFLDLKHRDQWAECATGRDIPICGAAIPTQLYLRNILIIWSMNSANSGSLMVSFGTSLALALNIGSPS